MNLLERAREHPLLKHFQWYGIAGSVLMLACVTVSMAAYVGTGAERYSPLNHFISELGQVGVSRLAVVFNAGLVISGVLYLPFTLGLGAALGGWWAAAGTLAGLVSAVSVACVGFYPMNDLPPHIAAAMTFFRSGLLTVLLSGIAIQRQRPGRRAVDRRANVAGVAAVLAFAAFLLWMQLQPGGTSGFHEDAIVDRPAVWPSAILEWSIFVAMVAWFFVVGACRRGAGRGTPPSRAPHR
jgi:hypothetical membrane protein